MTAPATVTDPARPTASGAVGPWTARLFLANLVAQTAIVVTGGLVRLTGSGLGCPTWPECVPGSYTPVPHQEEQWHKYVEFGNRTLTFLLVVIAAATLVAAVRHRPRRRAVLVLGAIPFVGTLAQAVLGGITVLTGLSPATVAAHFLLSMALIAAAVVLCVRGAEAGDGPVTPTVRAPIRPLSGILVVVAAAVITLGTVVTGSGPHAGDADVTTRFQVDPRTVSWLHADLVLLFVGLVVGILVASIATDGPGRVRAAAWWVLGVALAQGTVGYIQYFTGLPWLVVLVHQLGACLLWIVVVRLWLTTRSRRATA